MRFMILSYPRAQYSLKIEVEQKKSEPFRGGGGPSKPISSAMRFFRFLKP